VEHQRLGVGVLEQIGQLVVELALVDVDRDAADLHRREVGLALLGRVVEVHPDLAVRFLTAGLEARGETCRPLLIVAP
jgi:hypothetical protein